MALDVRVHRLSNAEYRRMVDAGALEGVSVELLDGLLVDVSPLGEQHARVVQALMAVLSGQPRLLRVQMPLAVAEGWVPEPDVALAERHADPARHPTTAMLAVEVAVSSQAEDRAKARVYARAGVARYWLIDVPAGTVSEHTRPTEDGYASVVELAGSDLLDAGVKDVSPTTVADLLAW